MKIAVSGTHFTGKSTLIASLLKKLPAYTSIEEPYYLLGEAGYEFSHQPSIEGFEQQFELSIKLINECDDSTIFDRCPFDFLAYALASSESSFDSVDVDFCVERMEGAIEKLDLIIFTPIEERILVPKSEDLTLRKNMSEKLEEVLFDDSLGLLEGIDVLEVTGSIEKRVQWVMNKLNMKESH